MKGLYLALVVLTGIGLTVTTLQVLLTFLKLRRHKGVSETSRSSDWQPLISIIKPVCGLEDELEENIASFARLTGVRYEVIISVADSMDPALPVIRRALERFPGAPFDLVIGGRRNPDHNRKIERLTAAMEHAGGEIIFISDSNVRVSPDDIADTIRHFDDPGVGCVSNLFVGAGARTIGARIDSLHLLTFVAPGCVIADAVGVPCVVGKSMAITRAAHDAIGGFAAFADRLGEDQAIAECVKEAGFRVVLSPRVVRNVVVTRSLSTAVNRQVRWGKIRYAFSRLRYTSEFAINPFPISIIAVLVAALSGNGYSEIDAAMPAAVLIGRLIQTMALGSLTRAGLSAVDLILVPIKDSLQFGAQFVPFFSNEVAWRGLRTRLGPGTRMMSVNAN